MKTKVAMRKYNNRYPRQMTDFSMWQLIRDDKIPTAVKCISCHQYIHICNRDGVRILYFCLVHVFYT